MANFMDLPMELVVEILSSLPAESLVPFKRVCSLWYSIINSRDFVAKHLQNANKILSTMSLFFISFNKELDEPMRSFLTIYDGDDNGVRTCTVIEDSLSSFFLQHTDEYLVSSQCNGVFCLYQEESNNVMLCNPTTREFNFLPDSCLRVKTYGMMLGFGYDPSVNSYKVVRAVLPDSRDDLSLRAEIYTLGSGSWREIKMNVMLSQVEMLFLGIAYGRNVSKQRYCKGACYWLLGPFCEKETVICFDMREEQFYRIMLPDIFEGEKEEMHTSLEIWNESVALFRFPNSNTNNVERPIEIWVMLGSFCRSGASCCWTKHLSIGPLESICRPIAFWGVDELLMSAEDGHVVSYNLHTQQPRNLLIPPDSLNDTALVFVKSLVSVHGRN